MGKSARLRWIAWLNGLFCAATISPAWASASLDVLRAEYASPNNRVVSDFAKLATDRNFEMGTDSVTTPRESDRSEQTIRANVRIGANGRRRLSTLPKTLCGPGLRSGDMPIGYDLSDLLVRKTADKSREIYLTVSWRHCMLLPTRRAPSGSGFAGNNKSTCACEAADSIANMPIEHLALGKPRCAIRSAN